MGNTTAIFTLRRLSSFIKFHGIKLDETIYKNYSINYSLSDDMKRLLGVEKSAFRNFPSIISTPLFPKQSECLLVYCDIIDANCYGNKSVHLLDILPLRRTYSKNGTLTIYNNISKSMIDNISIIIKN